LFDRDLNQQQQRHASNSKLPRKVAATATAAATATTATLATPATITIVAS